MTHLLGAGFISDYLQVMLLLPVSRWLLSRIPNLLAIVYFEYLSLNDEP